MTGEIEQLPVQGLTHVIGHDAAGVASRIPVGYLLPANSDIAVIGDSRAQADVSGSTASSARHGIRGIGLWLEILSRGRVRAPYAYNFAVAGSTTEDCVTSQLDSAAACAAGSVLVFTSTNDRTVSGDWSAARSITALQTIISTLIAAGKTVFLVAETPRGNSSYTSIRLTTSQLKRHNQVRQFLLRAQLTYGQNVRVIDLYPIMADRVSATGDTILSPIVAYDGLHPAIYTAYKIASSIVADPAFSAMYPAQPFLSFTASDVFDATDNPRGNLMSNGQLDGTSGTKDAGITGDVATGWDAGVSNWTGLSGVASKVTTATGDWQQFVITGDSGAGQPQLIFARDMSSFASVAVDDHLDGGCEWEVDASNAGLYCVSWKAARLNVSATVWDNHVGYIETDSWPSDAIAGVFRSSADVVKGATETRIKNYFLVYPAKSFVGVNITVRVRNMTLRKISGSGI